MDKVEEFRALQALENRLVKMRFNDGHEVVARLVNVAVDLDGSRHLVYDRVEWSSDSGSYQASENTCFYAAGETLVDIQPAAGATNA